LLHSGKTPGERATCTLHVQGRKNAKTNHSVKTGRGERGKKIKKGKPVDTVKEPLNNRNSAKTADGARSQRGKNHESSMGCVIGE